jgi:tRNA-Thr(GGU) m(6)t(6)A37 methyltransferase TsaA
MNRSYLMQPIGVIHSPFTEVEHTPIQPTRSHFTGQVEVFADYSEALEGIEGFSYLILLYVFHRSQDYQLKVKPFLDDREHGLFATRYPCRPNPIGLSIVRLLKRANNRLEIEGIDMLDGTPLLDIKPYVPDFDLHSDARTGWYETRNKA